MASRWGNGSLHPCHVARTTAMPVALPPVLQKAILTCSEIKKPSPPAVVKSTCMKSEKMLKSGWRRKSRSGFLLGAIAMHPVGDKRLCFEGFTLDLKRGCLRSGNEEIALRPKGFDLLRCLVENAGRLVSKDELIRSIWPNVIVTDESVTRCVSDVRLALGDRNQRLIKTVRKRGYLFLAPTVGTEPVVNNAGDRPTAAALMPPLSIVVLPFEDLGRNAPRGGFADAITDSLTTDLSRLPDYFVVARKSALTYKGREADVRQIGRALGVRYVVEGSVQRRARRIRVNARLVDAETGAHLWAERFDKTVGDLLDMQQEVTTRLTRALDMRLVAVEEQRLQHERSGNMSSVEFTIRGWAIYFRTLSMRGIPRLEECSRRR